MTQASRPLPEPSADERAHSDRLRARLEARLAAEGWLAFDDYMREVLYAPGLGYYATGTIKIGDAAAGGDFVTAPEISPLFARALAAQLAPLFAQVPAAVVEFGAGTGQLAAELLPALRGLGMPCRRYAIVEVSPDLRARQRERLAGEPIEWLQQPPDDFAGVMLANEVLDVMPVKLFGKRDGAVVERGVALEQGRLRFADRAPGAELAAAAAEIEDELGPLPDGYCSEIGLEARAWMRSAARWLGRGVLLAIDYGFPRREFYHPQRQMGTIMCHYRHHAHADPFWWPGLCDLTAHVDFSAMAAAAHGAGLEVLGYTTQAHFLLNCGLLDLLKAAHSPPASAAAQRLLSEAEMGELFKVLAVGRGVSAPLLGFAHGDRTARL
jgi:SAM-dependent MidA family methyltransferase